MLRRRRVGSAGESHASRGGAGLATTGVSQRYASLGVCYLALPQRGCRRKAGVVGKLGSKLALFDTTMGTHAEMPARLARSSANALFWCDVRQSETVARVGDPAGVVT
jgi:hypothetical protein